MIKKPLIVFDIGNVLLWFSLTQAKRNFDRLQTGTGDLVVKTLWDSPDALPFETGHRTGRDMFRLFEKKVDFSYTQFCRALEDIFDPIAENLTLLDQLSQSHPTAILSNINPIHWAYLMKNYPVLKKVRWPIASWKVGYLKPDKKIYEILMKRTGFSAENIVYADDRLELVETARAMGIRAVRFTGRIPLIELFAREGVTL